MGNSQNQKLTPEQVLEILPKDLEQRSKIENTCKYLNLMFILTLVLMEEIQLIHQIFEYLRLQSKLQTGIDMDVFVKYCPIPVSIFTFISS